MLRYQSLLAVALGGAAGSLTRWAVLEIAAGGAAGGDDRRALLAVFVINVAGSLLLGVLLSQRPVMSLNQFVAMGTGFCGGLTTFSTFAVDMAEALDDGRLLEATTNGLGTALLTLLAAGLGFRLGLISR